MKNDRHNHIIRMVTQNPNNVLDPAYESLIRSLYAHLEKALTEVSYHPGDPNISINRVTRTIVHVPSGTYVQIYDLNNHSCLAVGQLKIYEGHDGMNSFTKVY